MQFLICLVMWRYKGKHKVLKKCHYSCLVICWWNTREPQTGSVQVDEETASNIYMVVLNTLRPWPHGRSADTKWYHTMNSYDRNTEKFTKNVMNMHTSTNYVFCMWPSTWKCIEELKTYQCIRGILTCVASWNCNLTSYVNYDKLLTPFLTIPYNIVE